MSRSQRIVVVTTDQDRFKRVCDVLQIDHAASNVCYVTNADELACAAKPDYHLVIDRVESLSLGMPYEAAAVKATIPPEIAEYQTATRLAKAHRRNRLMERTTWVELDRHEEKGASYRCYLRGPDPREAKP